MKLLLTSAGITNKTIENKLSELLEKPFIESSITFVPTAANVEKNDKGWLIEDMHNVEKLDFKVFDMLDIAGVDRDIWFPSFERADIIMFGGGNVKYLLEQLKKTGVDQYIKNNINKKIYVGISAGSMVTAKDISLSYADILYYEETGEVQHTEGFGFIDFEIRPHFNSQWFPKVNESYLAELAIKTSSTFYAIDDQTAIVVEDDDISFVSEGIWKKFN